MKLLKFMFLFSIFFVIFILFSFGQVFVLDNFEDNLDYAGHPYSISAWTSQVETTIVQQGSASLKCTVVDSNQGVVQPILRSKDGDSNSLHLDLSTYNDPGDEIRFWLYFDSTTLNYPGFNEFKFQLSTGDFISNSYWLVSKPTSTGWTKIVLDPSNPTGSADGRPPLNWSSVDRYEWQFYNPNLSTGTGNFVVIFDEFELYNGSVIPDELISLEDFDDISDVVAAQGGTISTNTIPLYVNSGSSCRVADTDNGNVTIQSSSFDHNYNFTGYSTFRVSVYFQNVSRIGAGSDSITFRLFSQSGIKYNMWYLPIPSSNGWVTYERDLTDFDSDDGGGAINLTDVDAWRFDVNRISGTGNFVFYIDDLLILPPKTGETTEYWKYRTSDLIARINKTNGLLEKLTTISGIPKTVLPLTSRGLDITIKNVTAGWSGGIIGLASSSTSSGMIGGDAYNRIECQYTLDSANGLNSLISLNSQYTFFDDKMDIKFNVSYLQNSSNHYEIVMGQNYVPSNWQTELYPGHAWQMEYGTTGSIPTTAGEVILEYADAINSYYDFRTWDACIPYAIGGQGPFVALPYGVLQSSDTFFLWGYRDLGRFVILAPRRYNKIPSFLISPLNLTAGSSYSFDFTYKSFSKPKNTYTDVVKWYAENMYSTHPASVGLVTKPPDLAHRTIHYGNLATPGLYMYGRLSAYWSDLEDIQNETGNNLKMTNAWGAYWIDDEIYKTTGILHPSYGHETTPEELKLYFDYLKIFGIKPYLYFRQFLYTTYPSQPPYSSWKMLSEDGMAYQYAFGPVPPSTVAYVFADFTNPDFRNWYIQAVKDCVTYYGAEAVAWDMGWYDIYTSYVACSPPREGNGIHHGILNVQAEIYNWLKANYPEKKVTTNLSGYTPSALYADGIMFEGGTVRQRDVEAIKAFNLDIINLTYADSFKSQPQDVHIQSIMQAFALGATWASTTLELFEHPDPADPCHTRGLGLYLNDLEVLADYSALANSLPLMTESYAVISSSPNIYANAWADSNNLLIAVYNNTGGSASFSIDLNKEILAKYGQNGSSTMRAIHFNSHGLPDKTNVSLTKSVTADNCVRFQGNFGGNELVVIVKDIYENQRSPDHIYLSCDKRMLEPGGSTIIKIEVVDRFDRRFASSENVTVTVGGSGQIIGNTLIGASGNNKAITGTTNNQGYATITITDAIEETVFITPTSSTLPAQEPHQFTSVNFRYSTSTLIDGFVKVPSGHANAVLPPTQTSLEVKEGKVSLKLKLNSASGSYGLLQNNTAIPLDLSEYASGGYISWWMYIENPSGLTSYRFRPFTADWSHYEQVNINGPFSVGWNFYQYQLPLPINDGAPLNWGNFGHYKFEFYGVNGSQYLILIDDLSAHQTAYTKVEHWDLF